MQTNETVSIWPTVWRYSLYIAGFSVVFNLLLYMTGLSGVIFSLIGIAGPIVLLVLGLKSYRNANGGYMKYGQAFGIAFFASVVATIATAVINSIYLATAGQEILAAQRDEVIDQMAASPGMDAQGLEMMTGIMNSVFTPIGMLVLTVFGGILLWTIVSLILAAIMKRSPPLA